MLPNQQHQSTEAHTLHCNGHFPGKPGSAGFYIIFSLQWSLYWASTWTGQNSLYPFDRIPPSLPRKAQTRTTFILHIYVTCIHHHLSCPLKTSLNLLVQSLLHNLPSRMSSHSLSFCLRPHQQTHVEQCYRFIQQSLQIWGVASSLVSKHWCDTVIMNNAH